MEVRQNIVLQCQTHGFVKRRVVADSQNRLFDPTYGRNCCVYVDFCIECLPQKLEIHRSQQAFPLKKWWAYQITPKLVDDVGAYDSDGCRMDPGNNLG